MNEICERPKWSHSYPGALEDIKEVRELFRAICLTVTYILPNNIFSQWQCAWLHGHLNLAIVPFCRTVPCSLHLPSRGHEFLFHVKSEQMLSSWRHFLINWCSVCWHSEEILCFPEWSRLRTAELLWSAKVKFVNMIHAQDLKTFRAPDALILTGSPDTRAYKDCPVLTQALSLYSGTVQLYPKPHIFVFC